jgi:hypothetical protein
MQWVTRFPSVGVGGGHAVLARELGAVTLGVDHWFKLPAPCDAAELIRDGHAAKGTAVLEELNIVHEYRQPGQRTDAMIDAWIALRKQDEHNDVRMLATENAVVERLNRPPAPPSSVAARSPGAARPISVMIIPLLRGTCLPCIPHLSQE